jgi:hypothetical protein
MLCSDLPPERQSRADEYIRTLTDIEVEAKEIAQIQLAADSDNKTCELLTHQLASIKEEEIKGLEEAERIYERMVKAASIRRDLIIKHYKDRAKAEREEVETLRATCIARLDTVEARISEINARGENHRKRKHALEAEGGFELGLDVGLMKRARKER